MTASDTVLRDYVPDPPGGLTDIDDVVATVWAGGDALRLQQLAAAVTPSLVRPALGLLDSVPRPISGVLRTGLDLFLKTVPAL